MKLLHVVRDWFDLRRFYDCFFEWAEFRSQIFLLGLKEFKVRWVRKIRRGGSFRPTVADLEPRCLLAGSVTGSTWYDVNVNSSIDSGEVGLSGVCVGLYDASTNTAVAWTFSSSSGIYTFANVTTGSYFLAFLSPSGYGHSPQANASAPSPSNGRTGSFSVNNDTVLKHAGFYLTATGSVSGTTWNDADLNGYQNNGETGVSGVCIGLFNAATNTSIAWTAPNSFGYYQFLNVPAGTYYAYFVPPSSYTYGPQLGNSAPSASTGYTPNFSVGSGNVSKSAGFRSALGMISGTAWNDIDADSLLESGETGLSNVCVALYNAVTNSSVAFTSTNSSGFYQFSNVAAGSYYVLFNTPVGLALSPQANQSSPSPSTGKTASFSVSASSTATKHAGYWVPPGSVSGTIWNDSNLNSVRDASEIGIANLSVRLHNAVNNSIRYATTNAAGQYQFNNVAPGTYYVFFTLKAAHAYSPQAGESSPSATTGYTSNFTVGMGAVTKHAGEHSTTATISGVTWHDINGDSLIGVGETGLSGVEVKLRGAATGNLVASTTSNGVGQYQFSSVALGSYYVEFVPPTGRAISPKTGDSSPITGTGLTPAFALNALGATKNAGFFFNSASLVGRVWDDQDSNGTQDASETGRSMLIVTLYSAATNVRVGTTVTDSTGGYQFANLGPGAYYVQFGNLPANTSFATKHQGDPGSDSDASSDGRTDVFTILEGVQHTGIDAGLVSAPGSQGPTSMSPGSLSPGQSVNPWFNSAGRLPGGGSAGVGVANSFVGSAPSVRAAGGGSPGAAAAGNLFALLNPLGDVNPLYQVTAADHETPLFELHGGSLMPWFGVATGQSLPSELSSSTAPITLVFSGTDDDGAYTITETFTDSYTLTINSAAGTFALTETVHVSTFEKQHLGSQGNGSLLEGTATLVLVASGTYTSSSFTIGTFTLTENGIQTHTIDRLGPAPPQSQTGSTILHVESQINFGLTGAGSGLTLESFTIDSDGRETFTLIQHGQSSWSNVVDDRNSTVGGTTSFTLESDGSETFNLFIQRQRQGDDFATLSYTRHDEGVSTFSMTQEGGHNTFYNLDDRGSTSNSWESFNLSKTGFQSFTQHQEGADDNGVFSLDTVTRTDDGHDTFTYHDEGYSSAHIVVDDFGSTVDGTDSFSLDQTNGSETFHQELEGSARNGVFTASRLLRTDTATSSFSLHDDAWSEWHMVNDGLSTQDGSSSLSSHQTGSNLFTQTLEGDDHLGAFRITKLTSDVSGSSLYTLTDVGLSSWSNTFEPNDSTASGTDSYTQLKWGTQTFVQHQEGKDIGGIFATESLTDERWNQATFSMTNVSRSQQHEIVDQSGSFIDSTDSFTATYNGTESGTLHQIAERDQASGQLKITEYTQISSGSDTFTYEGFKTSNWKTSLDDHGSYESGTYSVADSKKGSESFSQTVEGHDESTGFVIDNLTSTYSGNNTFTREEESTIRSKEMTDDEFNYTETMDYVKQNCTGAETYSQYQRGRDIDGEFALESFRLDEIGNETTTSLGCSTFHTQKKLDQHGSYIKVTETTNFRSDYGGDCYSLHQEGRDHEGKFLTTYETNSQAGWQSFTLLPKKITTILHEVDPDEQSVMHTEEIQTWQKTGFESFAIEKAGGEFEFQFRISNLEQHHGAYETFHLDAVTTQTWTISPDPSETLARQEEGSAVNTFTKDGRTDVVKEQTGRDFGELFRITDYSKTTTNREEYHQKTTSTTTMTHHVAVVDARGNFDNANGVTTIVRDTTGNETYVLTETGSDQGQGFVITESLASYTGSETYIQTDHSEKSYDVGAPRLEEDLGGTTQITESRTHGSVLQDATYGGQTQIKGEQRVINIGNTASTTAWQRDFGTETFTMTSSGYESMFSFSNFNGLHSHRHYDSFTLAKEGFSSNDQIERNAYLGSERTSSSFTLDRSGWEKIQLNKTSTKDDENIVSY